MDAATVENKTAEMGSFAVFCNDDENLRQRLEQLAKKERLQELVLTIDNPAGPKDYEIAKSAEVTVLLYVNTTVRANHVFRKGELNEKAIDKILADVPKILPKN